MKSSTKDQVKGELHEMKGKVKEKAGQVTNNPNLVAEGQNEKLAGVVQKKIGQIEEVFEKKRTGLCAVHAAPLAETVKGQSVPHC